jgi:hypothetical protein
VNKYCFFVLCCLSFSAHSEVVSVTATIDRLYSYSEYGSFDGDVAIKISNPPAGCSGGF